jgi:hypothetical protein
VTADSYTELMRRLGEAHGAAQARRAEVLSWYERQRTAAARALADAEEDARTAAEEDANAQAEQAYVGAEVEGLWRALLDQVPAAARHGGPPTPDPQVDPDADPRELLRQAAARLRLARERRPVSGAAYVLFFLFGGLGAALAAAAGYGLRVAARQGGGDWAVALPVLALIVTLLGVVVGLVPTRLFADRRGLAVDAVSVIMTVFEIGRAS